ncbi:hypothetical protein DIPPA_35480 [Diplonema papillatum]|nr:hypothetical protein DIPPA_35480 [Diplonema papillatum]
MSPLTSAPSTPAPATVAPPSTAVPWTMSPLTSAPSTPAPATVAPPSTAVPPAGVPSTPAPATVAPPTAVPWTLSPLTSAPSTPAPATDAPPTAVPWTLSPLTSAPSTPAPATVAPPSTAVPPAGVPSTPAPATVAPPTAVPWTLSPLTSAPSTPAPGTFAPSTAVPRTSPPLTSAPSTHAPATDAPPTAVAWTLPPATGVPSTPAPATAVPGTPPPPTGAPPTESPPSAAPVPPPTATPHTVPPRTPAPAASATPAPQPRGGPPRLRLHGALSLSGADVRGGVAISWSSEEPVFNEGTRPVAVALHPNAAGPNASSDGGAAWVSVQTDVSPARAPKGLLALGDAAVTVTSNGSVVSVVFKHGGYRADYAETLRVALHPGVFAKGAGRAVQPLAATAGYQRYCSAAEDATACEATVSVAQDVPVLPDDSVVVVVGGTTIATAGVVGVATTGTGGLGANTGTKLIRVSLLLRAVSCPAGRPTPVDRTLSPLQLSVGPPPYEQYAGALVGNVALFAGFGAVCCAVYAVLLRVHAPRREDIRRLSSMALLASPSEETPSPVFRNLATSGPGCGTSRSAGDLVLGQSCFDKTPTRSCTTARPAALGCGPNGSADDDLVLAKSCCDQVPTGSHPRMTCTEPQAGQEAQAARDGYLDAPADPSAVLGGDGESAERVSFTQPGRPASATLADGGAQTQAPSAPLERLCSQDGDDTQPPAAGPPDGGVHGLAGKASQTEQGEAAAAAAAGQAARAASFNWGSPDSPGEGQLDWTYGSDDSVGSGAAAARDGSSPEARPARPEAEAGGSAREAVVLAHRSRFGALPVPAVFLYGGVVLSAFTILFYGSPSFAPLAASVLLFSFLLPGYTVFVAHTLPTMASYVRRVPPAGPDPSCLSPDVASKPSRFNSSLGGNRGEVRAFLTDFLLGQNEWVPLKDTAAGSAWVAMHALCFQHYTHDARYFLSVELTYIILLSVATAWAPEDYDACLTRAGIMAASPVTLLGLLLWWSPYSRMYENVMETVLVFLEAVMMGLTLHSMVTMPRQLDTWSLSAAGQVAKTLLAGVVVKMAVDIFSCLCRHAHKIRQALNHVTRAVCSDDQPNKPAPTPCGQPSTPKKDMCGLDAPIPVSPIEMQRKLSVSRSPSFTPGHVPRGPVAPDTPDGEPCSVRFTEILPRVQGRWVDADGLLYTVTEQSVRPVGYSKSLSIRAESIEGIPRLGKVLLDRSCVEDDGLLHSLLWSSGVRWTRLPDPSLNPLPPLPEAVPHEHDEGDVTICEVDDPESPRSSMDDDLVMERQHTWCTSRRATEICEDDVILCPQPSLAWSCRGSAPDTAVPLTLRKQSTGSPLVRLHSQRRASSSQSPSVPDSGHVVTQSPLSDMPRASFEASAKHSKPSLRPSRSRSPASTFATSRPPMPAP